MMKYGEIKAIATKKTDTLGVANIFAYYIWVPIAFSLTKFFLLTPLTPNMISCLSGIFPIIGFIIISLNISMAFNIIGVSCFVLWVILDSVDGDVARVRKQFSPSGDLWDAAAGYVAMPFMFLSMGVCAYYRMNSNLLFAMLGALTALFSLYPRLLMHFKYSDKGSRRKNDGGGLNDKSSYGFLKRIAFNLTAPDALVIPFMYVAVVAGVEWLFVLGYFVLYLLILIVASYNVLFEDWD